MATLWSWPARDRRTFWDRVRTIGRDVGEPVVRVLEIPGAFVPGASQALEKVGALFGADLTISELDSPEVLEPLDGAPGPFASEDQSSPVFIDGLKASVTVAHNGKGTEGILLERLDLRLLEYRPEPIPALETERDAAEVFGAGFIEPLRFFVEVGKAGPGRARRAVRNADGRTEMVTAQGPNALDTEPPSFLAIGAGEPPAMFRFAITAHDAGLYSVCLRWFYRVAARELRQHTSLPVLIYKG
jgi:hypothetical protein